MRHATETTDWDRELELAMARHLRHAHRRMDDAARRIMDPATPPPPARTPAMAIGEYLGGIHASLVDAMRDLAVGLQRARNASRRDLAVRVEQAARRRGHPVVGYMDQPGICQRLRRQ